MTTQNDQVRFGVFTTETYKAGGKEYTNWTRIGVAFPHKDGKGFNLKLNALPVNGEAVIRVIEPKEGKGDQPDNEVGF